MPGRRVLLVTISSLLLVSCGSGVASSSATSTTSSTTTTLKTTTTTRPITTTSTSTTTTQVSPVELDQGLLPQTKAVPPASGAAFQKDAHLLWDAIVSGDPQLADPFFFPLAAYIQVKGISDPVHDYDTRLIYDYDIDLLAYHRQLAGLGSDPKFVRLSVPENKAQWILPGVEYNKGSYWRVFGSKLYFSINGVTHDFPIYSLISWRGRWYVVHVGPPTS